MDRGTKRDILVVEDEDDIRELIRHNLARNGYGVTAAGDGETALQIAVRRPPSLILLDLMLPDINGLEVCRVLRQDPKTAAVPIIIVTARGEESDVVAGLETGADDYVTKPFNMNVLLARVRAALRRRGPAGPGRRCPRRRRCR
jgi:two-component system phosphate regulon response regulator PhoB